MCLLHEHSAASGPLPAVYCETALPLLRITNMEHHHRPWCLLQKPDAASWRLQDEGTARALRLAQYVNVPVYIVHVMSGGAVAEIAAAKTRGQRVVGEAVASGFGADEAKIWDPDFKVVHPP